MMRARYVLLVGVGLAAAATTVHAGSLRFTIEAPVCRPPGLPDIARIMDAYVAEARAGYADPALLAEVR